MINALLVPAVRFLARHALRELGGALLERLQRMATQNEQVLEALKALNGKIDGVIARKDARIRAQAAQIADLTGRLKAATVDPGPLVTEIRGMGERVDAVETGPMVEVAEPAVTVGT